MQVFMIVHSLIPARLEISLLDALKGTASSSYLAARHSNDTWFVSRRELARHTKLLEH